MLPNLLVIGAMKCGTTALHRYLGGHPEIAMSEPKELNFFFGPAQPGHAAVRDSGPPGEDRRAWTGGNWHRGLRWYAAHFDPAARVRGESSPGYTSPAHPEAADRIAATLPGVRLIYLVRDPVERALSQYRHHAREGTERRPPEAALLDGDSQYVARSRYFERLRPFLERFAGDRLLVVAQEDLRSDCRRTLETLFAFLEVAGAVPRSVPREPVPAGTAGTRPDGVPGVLRRRLADAVRDDTERLRAFTGREFPLWQI